MLRVTRQWRKKSGETGVSVDELLHELLGGEGRALYVCKGDPRLGRVDIRVWRVGDRTFQYWVEDTESSGDLSFVVDVLAALKAPNVSRGECRLTTMDERRAFFLAALDLKSRVQVKDLIAAYELMAETGQPLPALVEELGLT